MVPIPRIAKVDGSGTAAEATVSCSLIANMRFSPDAGGFAEFNHWLRFERESPRRARVELPREVVAAVQSLSLPVQT